MSEMESDRTEGIINRYNEDNYRLLAENSTDLIARISIQGICLYVSPACRDLLGYTPEEIMGQRAFNYIHPLDRRTIADSLDSEVIFRFHKKVICRLKRRDGYFGWFESKFQFFTDAVTGELQVVVIARDIGDRIRAERFSTVRHTIAALDPSGADLEKEFASLLKTICTTLTWDIGEIWLVEEKTSCLKLCGQWCGTSPRLMRFSETSSSMAFAPGVGLPGLIWSGDGVTLVDDLSTQYSTVRRKEYNEAGLKSAIGALLGDESGVYGIILFISRRSIQHNQELLNMIEETGLQLGAFIAKFRAREKLKAESEKLGSLVEESGARIRELQAAVSRQQKFEQDILMAAEVQRNLMPVGSPMLPDFDFSFAAIPARYISGDFYDFAMPSPSICDIIIADVSGKGISAAMMTTAARAFFRHDDSQDKTPGEILRSMNDALFADLDRTEMFLTAQIIRIDETRGTIVYASAGHPEIIRFNPYSEECTCYPSTSLPIGILQQIEVGEKEILTRPGDFLVIYSDGVTEAADMHGGLFGMERFVDILHRHCFTSPMELVQRVVTEVRSFSGDQPLADDLTLVAIGVNERKHHLSIEASMEHLDSAVEFVRKNTLSYGEKVADAMELVASELITNVIKYSTSVNLDISVRLGINRVALDLSYPGEPFTPDISGRALPNPLQEGGRGIHIVRSLVDVLKYTSSPTNHWHVEKRIPPTRKNI